jgi:hypothetical protein
MVLQFRILNITYVPSYFKLGLLCIIPNITYTEDMEICPNDARDNNAPHFLLSTYCCIFLQPPLAYVKKIINLRLEVHRWSYQQFKLLGKWFLVFWRITVPSPPVSDYNPLKCQELREQ